MEPGRAESWRVQQVGETLHRVTGDVVLEGTGRWERTSAVAQYHLTLHWYFQAFSSVSRIDRALLPWVSRSADHPLT